MNHLVNLLALSSVYIFIIGVFFLAIRSILNKINCSQVLVYRLWLVFPLGLLVMLILPYFNFSITLSNQLTMIQLPSFTVHGGYNLNPTDNLISWLNFMVISWFVLVLFNLIKLVFNYLNFKKLLVSSSSKTAKGIYSSDKISTPLAFGVINANVFVPTVFTKDEYSQLLIKHEQVHCARNDPFIRILYKIMTSIFWFHPMMYVLNKTMIKDQETSCDELVLANSNQVVAYSKLLLRLNQNNLHNNHYLPGLYCSSISMLKERIMLINKLKLNNNKTLSYALLLVAIIGMTITTTALAEMGKDSIEAKPNFPAILSSEAPKPNFPAILSTSTVPKPNFPAILLASEAPVKHLSKYPSKNIDSLKSVSDKGIEVLPIKTVAPHYPRKAVTKKIEGFVILDVDIGAKGNVLDLRVIESVPEGVFDIEAVKSVKKWTFTPVSQPVTVQQKIEFKLANPAVAGYGVIK